MNGQRLPFDAFVKWIEEWRPKTSEYKLVVDEFLRDGDRLAAHMTRTIKVDGADTTFESFMFARVEKEKESGEMEWLIERSIWALLVVHLSVERTEIIHHHLYFMLI
ncbi:hypothetical protein F5B21DRAFT_96478 [Xylaria acuta]|nr:hypothetical protein F5B21DRAFT_96478 [Xylaria acuta]